MVYEKRYKNGLRLVVKEMEGLMSVTMGILVGTGAGIETDAELDKLSITFTSSKGKLLLYDDGRLMPNQMDRVHEVFRGNDRCLTVDFDSGNFRAQSWGRFLWESD